MTNKKTPEPPRLAQWLLSYMPEYEEKFCASGDLNEFYQKLCQTDGKKYSDRWYWKQVLFSFIPYFFQNLNN